MKLCQFQVLSPGPMFNTPPNKKEQMHLSHLHIRNNYSIPREMFLFVPRGAKRLSRRFLCLVKHRDLNVLGCLAAIAAKHWRSTVAVLANKNLFVQCNVIISMGYALICVILSHGSPRLHATAYSSNMV